MEPNPPDLFELIKNWLTNKSFEYSKSGDSISLDVPKESPTHTVNIMEDHNNPFGIIVLSTGLYGTEDDHKNKVNCSPAHKFDDTVYSVGISFSHLDCRAPDFFERLLTILSSPPSTSTSFNILNSWSENDNNPKC